MPMVACPSYSYAMAGVHRKGASTLAKSAGGIEYANVHAHSLGRCHFALNHVWGGWNARVRWGRSSRRLVVRRAGVCAR